VLFALPAVISEDRDYSTIIFNPASPSD